MTSKTYTIKVLDFEIDVKVSKAGGEGLHLEVTTIYSNLYYVTLQSKKSLEFDIHYFVGVAIGEVEDKSLIGTSILHNLMYDEVQKIIKDLRENRIIYFG